MGEKHSGRRSHWRAARVHGRLLRTFHGYPLAFLFLVLGCLWSAGAANAQQTVSLSILDATSTAEGNVEMVITVLDERGMPVKGLSKANFGVSVEGQEIETFSVVPISSTESPLSVVLGIDVSGSMHGAPIREAKRAASRFLDQLDREDFTALMAFGSSVRFPTEFTQDKTEVREQIEKLAATEQWTWLYQGTREALEKASRAPTSRVAIVLLTDGKDEGSPTTEQDVVSRIGGTPIPLYTLGFRANAPVDYLKRIASISGGSFLFAPRPEDLSGLYDTVLEQLQNQYSVHFAFPQPSGQYKSTVALRYQGAQVTAQRDFLHTYIEPPPWWKELPVHPAILVVVGFTLVISLVVALRRPVRAVATSSAGKSEPQVSLMFRGESHPIGAPGADGGNPMTVMLQPTPGEVGLKIGLNPVPLSFALMDSKSNKEYRDVIITRYDPERPFRKEKTYLLLTHPTVHRPDKETAGHARIYLDKTTGRYLLQDLGSTLGTKLNEAVCKTVLPLEDGDRITLGGITLTYYDKRASTGGAL